LYSEREIDVKKFDFGQAEFSIPRIAYIPIVSVCMIFDEFENPVSVTIRLFQIGYFSSKLLVHRIRITLKTCYKVQKRKMLFNKLYLFPISGCLRIFRVSLVDLTTNFDPFARLLNVTIIAIFVQIDWM